MIEILLKLFFNGNVMQKKINNTKDISWCFDSKNTFIIRFQIVTFAGIF